MNLSTAEHAFSQIYYRQETGLSPEELVELAHVIDSGRFSSDGRINAQGIARCQKEATEAHGWTDHQFMEEFRGNYY